MRPKRKVISLLLAICLVAGLMPTVASAATDTGKAIRLGTGVLQEDTNTANAAAVYFGKNNEDKPGA